ncbi:putative YccA/Bax inhibitor family protein [Humibacillus xanthopallidus]|uniref:Putative YccA/Bax inhibitor family protein n=1 Tax=Humibacillus xanthopallidus TaxID=412689 RepID=A0A543PY73_9MICO|nr:Bax inhibitor-1/YccA family protein [Humibacillus xanthopallidus]TQN48991.1 putative YccA/Bax inhibitor family protein [Humibacillus xanthopallidus]
MAGGNPVFDRLNKQIEKERYAGFGAPQGSPQQPAQQGTQAATTGYATQDAMTAQQLNDMYARQAAGPADTGRVTIDDIIIKSAALFVLTVAVAGVSWAWTAANPSMTLLFWMGGMIGTLVIGLGIAFMKKVSVPLIMVYAVLQGAFLGAFSQYINSIPQYEGVVQMAVLATLCVFVAMYIGYATGFVKVNAKTRRMFFFAIVGYALFSLLQVVLLWTGVISGWGFGGSGSLGIILSLLGVGLASYSLAIDFDSIDHAVQVGAPKKYSWLLAHGLIVSIVWLYIEFVRLFARLRD